MINQVVRDSVYRFSELRKNLLRFQDGDRKYLDINGIIKVLENRIDRLSIEFRGLLTQMGNVSSMDNTFGNWYDPDLKSTFECDYLNAGGKVPNSPSVVRRLTKYSIFPTHMMRLYDIALEIELIKQDLKDLK